MKPKKYILYPQGLLNSLVKEFTLCYHDMGSFKGDIDIEVDVDVDVEEGCC